MLVPTFTFQSPKKKLSCGASGTDAVHNLVPHKSYPFILSRCMHVQNNITPATPLVLYTSSYH